MTIAERLRQARLDKGLTLQDVADLTGVCNSTIYRYERGEIKRLKEPVLKAIAGVLNIPLSDLWVTEDASAYAPEPTVQTDFTGMAPIRQRIIYRREWLRMSRSELALATGLPDMESVEAIESGRAPLTPELIGRISKGLRCTNAELVGCTVTEWSTFCHVWQLLNP